MWYSRGEARAYPIRILNWHEIVNDQIGQEAFVVTYCPLCGTGMVFDARVGGKKLSFGVSGLLYQSDVLLYDRESESLWSQLKMQAVSGEHKGTKLKLLPATHTTWKAWKKRYPQTKVLSIKTGYNRDYDRNPYQGYSSTPTVYFPIANQDKTFPAKTWTFAIKSGSSIMLYPLEKVLSKKGKSKKEISFNDTVGGEFFKITIDPNSREVLVTNQKGKQYPIITGYWFALRAFYPRAQVF